MKVAFLKAVSLLCIVCLVAGCGGHLQSSAHETVNLSTWVAYWDMEDGVKEYQQVKGKLQSVSYFCAYFNEKDQLFIPKEVQQAKRAGEKPQGGLTYLTFVNDKVLGKDQFAEKNLDVLRRTFADGISMNKHVNTIIDMAKEGGYAGIEIDYEKIWKDDVLPQQYLHFLDVLYRHASSQGLKVRVILEPSMPFDSGFCDGPEYVVMLYNLYGTHSDPGPKANKAFILKILKRMEALPGTKGVAFSTGGCLWNSKGKKRFIEEEEARQLAQSHGAIPQRDGDSAVMNFTYMDEGDSYTVWYADSETLNAWITVAADQGITNINLWRLGGNVDIQKVSKS